MSVVGSTLESKVTAGEVTLTRTYFLARKEDLRRCYERYLERIERVKQFTQVYLIANEEVPESSELARENLLSDLRAQSDDSLVEDEWGLYSYATALRSLDEPIAPQPPSRACGKTSYLQTRKNSPAHSLARSASPSCRGPISLSGSCILQAPATNEAGGR